MLASHPSRPSQRNGGPLCWLPWLGSLPPSTPSFTINVSSFAIFSYYLKVCSSASRTFNLDIIFLFFTFLSYFVFFFFRSVFFLFFFFPFFFSFLFSFFFSFFLVLHRLIQVPLVPGPLADRAKLFVTVGQ